MIHQPEPWTSTDSRIDKSGMKSFVQSLPVQRVPPAILQMVAMLDTRKFAKASLVIRAHNAKSDASVTPCLPNGRKVNGMKSEYRLDAPKAGSVWFSRNFTGWEKSPTKMDRLSIGPRKSCGRLNPVLDSNRLLPDGRWFDDYGRNQRATNSNGFRQLHAHS
jgi:hypothetical protein